MTTNTYARNFIVATNKAAKVYGTDATQIRANYRDFKNAPGELKRSLLLAYKIMKNYAKAPIAETAAA